MFGGQIKDMFTSRARRLLSWAAVLCMLAIIYGFSLQTGQQSSQSSAVITKHVAQVIVPDFEEASPKEQERIINRLQPPVRKAAHMLEFMALGSLLMLAWAQHPVPGKKRILLSTLMAAVAALLDELIQTMVAGRGAAFRDVGIDMLGAMLGIAFTCIFSSVKNLCCRPLNRPKQ